MKKFLITIHTEDTQCVVTAENEEEAEEKYFNDDIDEWLTAESEQPFIGVELFEENENG